MNAGVSAAELLAEPRLAKLLGVLNGAGEEARVVGGAVRNSLMGLKVADTDVATTALPDVTMARCAAAGYRTVPTGLKHGTVTVVIEGMPFEVTTLREDVETDGRYATVRFGRDFEADALRRDFTINALSLSADGRLHDYCGGLTDIAARRVRFIGDPEQRIREDYLRILRLFRFHAAYGMGRIDPAGLQAAIRLRAGLARLSRERVRTELLKLLDAPGAAPVVAEMADAGLLVALLGTAPERGRFTALAEMPEAAGPVLLLGALAVRVREDAARLREALRLSNAEAARLEALAGGLERWHGCPPPLLADQQAAAACLLFEAGRETAGDLVLVRAAQASRDERRNWLAFHAVLARIPVPVLPLTGEELLQRGLPSGRLVGRVLKAFQALWIRAGFPQEPGALSRLIDEAMVQARRD